MSYSRKCNPHSPDKRQPVARAPKALAYCLIVLFLAASEVAGTTAAAQAASPYGKKAVAVAASKHGAPYALGATGPNSFDCSGLTLYAFRKVGHRLPRTADQQYKQTRRIPPVRRAPGDLVFFPQGNTMGHVGIYAGREKIWHAPRPGGRVRLERIWSKNVRYGRTP
ncbi:C40 family peptidase [Streptomyces sp. NPDC003002]